MRAIVRSKRGGRVIWEDTGIRYPNPSLERQLAAKRANPGYLVMEVDEASVPRTTSGAKAPTPTRAATGG